MKKERKDLAIQLPVYADFRTFKTQVQYLIVAQIKTYSKHNEEIKAERPKQRQRQEKRQTINKTRKRAKTEQDKR